MAVKPNGDGGKQPNLKGRLNFSTLGSAPGHILTLSDSDFAKTIATANNRPENDANDAFIGFDHGNGDPAQVGISLGAPRSLSSYIGNVGDGNSWKEQLTAKAKTFAVPVVIQGWVDVDLWKWRTNLPNGHQARRCKGQPGSISGMHRRKYRGSRRESEMQIVSLLPPGPLGNLSLNAYVLKANTVTLHFCNVSTQAANVPAGQYSFFAVR